MINNKRVLKEYSDFQKDQLPNLSVNQVKEDDIYEWEGTIIGPEDTPYENGIFKLRINIPNDYPFKPPQIEFKTKIYHCNVSSKGEICLDILKEKWTPALTISKTLLSICSLLSDPNPDDPLVSSIASKFKNNRKEHDETARNWTKLYATYRK